MPADDAALGVFVGDEGIEFGHGPIMPGGLSSVASSSSEGLNEEEIGMATSAKKSTAKKRTTKAPSKAAASKAAAPPAGPEPHLAREQLPIPTPTCWSDHL